MLPQCVEHLGDPGLVHEKRKEKDVHTVHLAFVYVVFCSILFNTHTGGYFITNVVCISY